jgi:hypothetical protein
MNIKEEIPESLMSEFNRYCNSEKFHQFIKLQSDKACYKVFRDEYKSYSKLYKIYNKLIFKVDLEINKLFEDLRENLLLPIDEAFKLKNKFDEGDYFSISKKQHHPLTTLAFGSLIDKSSQEKAKKILSGHANDVKYAATRTKKNELFKIWETGKYKYHTHCAKCEHKALGLTEGIALTALRKKYPKRKI